MGQKNHIWVGLVALPLTSCVSDLEKSINLSAAVPSSVKWGEKEYFRELSCR